MTDPADELRAYLESVFDRSVETRIDFDGGDAIAHVESPDRHLAAELAGAGFEVSDRRCESFDVLGFDAEWSFVGAGDE